MMMNGLKKCGSKNKMKSNIIIPERFEKRVLIHAVRISQAKLNNAPLILGISGPPGEGKTFQCDAVLKRIGYKTYRMSAGEFESADAGVPAEKLRTIYDDAKKYVETETKYAAIIIDDADVAFGNWGELVQYTVNTQNVIGQLMSLADTTASTSVRIPIYFTGNDFGKLYGPLKRTGRMDFFHWAPQFIEKVRAVFFGFECLSIQEAEELVSFVNALCQEYNLQEAPISFYSSLKSFLFDENIWTEYLSYKHFDSLNDTFTYKGGESLKNECSLATIKELARQKILDIYYSEYNNI